jgi:MFS family permease
VALWVPWADRTLGIGTSGWRFGLVFSVWGLGGILASALTPWLLRRASPARLTLVAIPLSGVAGVCVALSTHWVAAAALMVGWGVAYQVVIINSLTYRQQVTPEHLLSRVNTAGRMLSWGLGWTLGAVVAGGLATHLGVPHAMLALTCVGLVAAAYAWLSPLRGIAAATPVGGTATSGTATSGTATSGTPT